MCSRWGFPLFYFIMRWTTILSLEPFTVKKRNQKRNQNTFRLFPFNSINLYIQETESKAFLLSVSISFRLFPFDIVEVEGIEPSSNHGPNKLSTCLVIDLIFVIWQAQDYQPYPYPLNFEIKSRLPNLYFRFILHHLVQTSRNRAMGWCLVRATVAQMKLTYYTSVRQRERNCYFRQL